MLFPQNGCVALLKRLQPIRDENPDISWEDLVSHFVTFCIVVYELSLFYES